MNLLTGRIQALTIAASMFSAAACSSGTPSTTPPSAAPTATASPASTASASPSFTGLLPDGAWQVDLTKDELAAGGAEPGSLPDGSYTWTFEGHRAQLSILHDGKTDRCSAEASAAAGGVLFTYLSNLGCGGWTDTISWQVAVDGLHLKLVDSTAPREQDAPYLEAKPWQSVPATPIPAWPDWSIRCEPGCQGPIGAGEFTSNGFFPGMTMQFADGDWFNTSDWEDELEFDLGDTAFRFFRNPHAALPTAQPDPAVGATQAALVKWFVENHNMVVTKPRATTLGSGIKATTFEMRISDANVNADPGCPVKSCLSVLWVSDGHDFAVGYGSADRFDLFTLGNGDVIVASVDAPNDAGLAAINTKVDALLGSIGLP